MICEGSEVRASVSGIESFLSLVFFSRIRLLILVYLELPGCYYSWSSITNDRSDWGNFTG